MTEPDFYSDLSVIADPKPLLEMLRTRGPMVREAYQGSMMVTGYDEAVEVLTRKDGTLSSAVSVIGPIPPLPFTPEGPDISAQLEAHRDSLPWSNHLTTFDGDKHAFYRSILTGVLTYKRLKANEDYLHGLADRMIDGFIAKGRCNVIPEFGHATTTYAISDLLGIPEAHRAELLELIGAPPSQVDGDAPAKIGPDPLIFMKPRFDEYIRERQEKPCGDLMSDLANVRHKDGTQPPFDMLSALARFLFGAGQDTTSHLISSSIKVMAERPDLQERLRADLSRIPDFIEEILRFDPPVKTAYRIAVVDTEICGTPVKAGTILTVVLTAAGNDPAHFADPQQFDIDRADKRDHLAFSRGIHGCLGAPLGRLEARVALEQLLKRVCNIRLSDEHHGPPGARIYRYQPTYAFRSLCDLHIEFDAVAA